MSNLKYCVHFRYELIDNCLKVPHLNLSHSPAFLVRRDLFIQFRQHSSDDIIDVLREIFRQHDGSGSR